MERPPLQMLWRTDAEPAEAQRRREAKSGLPFDKRNACVNASDDLGLRAAQPRSIRATGHACFSSQWPTAPAVTTIAARLLISPDVAFGFIEPSFLRRRV